MENPETRRITDIDLVRRVYDERMRRDFARNELRSWESIRRSWERDAYLCYGLYAGEELLGYAFFVRLETGGGCDCLFDYLAVAEEYRDQGLGSRFLRQLSGCVPEARCIVGEVEDPEAARDPEDRRQRERRVRFYLRAGYLDTGVTSRLFGVDYRILEVPVGPPHSPAEIRGVYTELYRSILPPAMFRTCFALLPPRL